MHIWEMTWECLGICIQNVCQEGKNAKILGFLQKTMCEDVPILKANIIFYQVNSAIMQIYYQGSFCFFPFTIIFLMNFTKKTMLQKPKQLVIFGIFLHSWHIVRLKEENGEFKASLRCPEISCSKRKKNPLTTWVYIVLSNVLGTPCIVRLKTHIW